ncbi:MAG: hypothetical protein WCW13_03620 [archaeon]|jgi:hypothetical protein
MKAREIGLIIIGIAILLGFVIFSFNQALIAIVNETCSHGPTCPMWGTIDFQTNVGIGIMVVVLLVGLYFIFFVKDKKEYLAQNPITQIMPRKITKEEYTHAMEKMNPAEKSVFEHLIENNGSIYQSILVEKTNFGKVKMTRILDKLESQDLIERKRRGMTNIVTIKR